jgi:glycosyltransferase
VITVVRNAVRTIDETLTSVATQTARDLEHIVVDGGSSDGTLGLVRARGGVRLVSGHDHGIYDAMNRGVALARGRWINFLNADDTYAHPRVLERVLAAEVEHPGVEVFFGDIDLMDAAGRLVRPVRHAGALRLDVDNPVNHQATFMTRAAFVRLGGFDDTYALAGDYDLLLRARSAGVSLHHLPDVLARMRVGGRSADERALRLELMRAWWRRTGRFPWRQLLRFTKVHVLDPCAPRLSAALGGVRRARRALLDRPS